MDRFHFLNDLMRETRDPYFFSGIMDMVQDIPVREEKVYADCSFQEIKEDVQNESN